MAVKNKLLKAFFDKYLAGMHRMRAIAHQLDKLEQIRTTHKYLFRDQPK